MEILEVKEKLENFRTRINNGESFTTLAALYSEDKGSAAKGGELGFVGRGDLVPEFAAVAFNLKGKEVSRIVKTEFGYHIIQLIEKKGELINVRHILLKPRVSPGALQQAYGLLDSVKQIIEKDTLSFKHAAWRFSDDKDTRTNGGLMINMYTGSSKFEIKEIEPAVYNAIKNLEINEISAPFKTIDQNGYDVYKIVQLKSKSNPHKANLKDDYQLIQDMALAEKQQKFMNEWIKERREATYVKIKDEYKTCKFQYAGW
jgi:peptidyl-prolyl cis-trans isomerase SurA